MTKANMIKMKREALGLDPKTVAIASDMSLKTYKAIEEGKADPERVYFNQIVCMSKVLDMDLNALVSAIG